jgi:hypothetical protein
VPPSSLISRAWESGDDFKKGVEGDHRSIVKLSPLDLRTYQRVKYVLETNYLKNALDVIQKRFQGKDITDCQVKIPKETSAESILTQILPPYLGPQAILYRGTKGPS